MDAERDLRLLEDMRLLEAALKAKVPPQPPKYDVRAVMAWVLGRDVPVEAEGGADRA